MRQQPASTGLPAGFAAEAAVLCPLTMRGRGHSGFPKQETDRGLAPLMAALRRPREPPTPGTACAAQAVPVPLLFLIGRTGRVIRPVIPDDACGRPQQQFLHALQHLPWVTVSGAG
jgi:hypothetical protein